MIFVRYLYICILVSSTGAFQTVNIAWSPPSRKSVVAFHQGSFKQQDLIIYEYEGYGFTAGF